MAKIVAALKIAILENFSSQSDFAHAVGEHESKVSQVVRGRRKLSHDQAEKWLEILDCDPSIFKSVIANK